MEKENYLSIITNFGCHYKCPYCIVKNNNLHIPRTTISGLSELKNTIIDNSINIVSLSGGGDPCHEYYKNSDWYDELNEITSEFEIPLELHTNYIDVSFFPYHFFKRIVYHILNISDIDEIRKYNEEEIRVVFVADENLTKSNINEIVKKVKENKNDLKLSFRQMVDSNYKTTYHLHEFLKQGHKKEWWYIEQNDYNLYYSENKLSYKYEDFKPPIKNKR